MSPTPGTQPSFPFTVPALGRLSPAHARLCLGIGRFCREELGLAQGAHLLLALSGGADSTALAVLLFLLAPRLEWRLSALTIDHGLRPESADDARHARALCQWLGIPCRERSCDVAAAARTWGCGVEEAGRRLRYALLEEERDAVNADWIVLGHHAGDLSEDVLMRLTRGAGWPGLGGMPARDGGRRLLRPLLFTMPDTLRALLRQLGVGWREDASNASHAFRRNRLRHDVLPLLRRENPALERGNITLHRLAALDAAFWEETLARALAAHPWQEVRQNGAPGLLLPRDLLEGLHPAARLRLYVRACRTLGRTTEEGNRTSGQPRASTLLKLDAALREGRGNTRFQLPGGVEGHLRAGSVLFTRTAQSPRSRARPVPVTPRTSRP